MRSLTNPVRFKISHILPFSANSNSISLQVAPKREPFLLGFWSTITS